MATTSTSWIRSYHVRGSDTTLVTGTSWDDSSVQITSSDTGTSDATSGGYYHTYNIANVHPESNPIIGPIYKGPSTITSSDPVGDIEKFGSDVFMATTANGTLTIYKTTNTAPPFTITVGVKGF